MECFRLFAVEHCKNDSSGTEEFSKSGDGLFGDRRLHVVEDVPEQDGIEGGWRVLKTGLNETGRAAGRRQINVAVRSSGGIFQPGFFFRQEILERVEKIVRSD